MIRKKKIAKTIINLAIIGMKKVKFSKIAATLSKANTINAGAATTAQMAAPSRNTLIKK